MTDPFGLPDLRHLISGSPHIRTNPQLLVQNPLIFSAAPPNNSSYDVVMGGDQVFPRGFVENFGGHDDQYCTSTAALTPTRTISSDHIDSTTTAFCGMESCTAGDNHSNGCGTWVGYDVTAAGNSRWPRQETLSLLEIRSRLDSKFKETNHKGPLWNQVSRLMAEEHGYQRSGKKCKEKFENLYKYYKKTKEGKSGRQDGKHYRFFRQLEAIYGQPNTSTTHASASQTHHASYGNTTDLLPYQNPINNFIQENQFLKPSQSLSFSNSSDQFETSSSENNDNDNENDLSAAIACMMKQTSGKAGQQSRESVKQRWTTKVEEFVGSQIRKITETQDVMMEKILSTIEYREKEMMATEEERRRQEAVRFDQQVHDLWVKERAWIEARDAALMHRMKNFIGKGPIPAEPIVKLEHLGNEKMNLKEDMD
ncbi:Trihelix transcription factor PTL [Quillaja saponaria]|uniref:Trihelix transcription factor PTL n=1 Tax=Quillaja saponaria TaxID=32244 RepID=A0AAD7PWV2_QUISA|nr:Trihelix transcription factor PTL [Quillaja saponaria]